MQEEVALWSAPLKKLGGGFAVLGTVLGNSEKRIFCRLGDLRSVPRLPRLDFPGQLYHLIVRGVERRAIFRSDDDRIDFLTRLAHYLEKTESACLTWALMSNHVHLLVISGVRGLAALMHPLLTGFVGAYNRRWRRVGHLVQNRYKAILCQQDTYLFKLLSYIPLNPVRAGLAKTPEALARYPWTGHAAILGNIPRPWQAVDQVLSYFGDQRGPARDAYESSIRDAWSQGHRDDLEGGGLIRSMGGMANVLRARASGEHQSADFRILGDGDFVDRILERAEGAERQKQQWLASGLTVEVLQQVAARLTGVDPATLFTRIRCRPVAAARAMYVYAATELLGRSSLRCAWR